MTKIEEINKDLLNMGFTIDGENYIYEKVIHNQIIVNGQRMVQEQKVQIGMTYIGDGCELDENNNEIEGTTFCGFELKNENGESLMTVYVSDAKDFYYYINL